MNVEIVPATLAHARALAPLMREQDKDEVMASGGLTPLEALVLSVNSTTPDLRWTILMDGIPAAMWGAAGDDSSPDHGIVWLLASPTIYKLSRRRFYAESNAYVARMLKRFATLANCVDARNSVSMRWLENLGFRCLQIIDHYGVERRPFVLYAKHRSE